MRAAATAGMVIACAALAAAAAAAPTVSEIVVRSEGPGRADAGYVRAHVATRAGEELDRARLGRDVKALLATGLFSDVRAEIEGAGGEAVRLLLTVRSKLRLVCAPAVSGVGWVREKQVRKLLALREGDLADEDDFADRARRVEADYRKKLRPGARVTWKTTVTDQAEGLASVAFQVEEGNKERVRRVLFSGNASVPSKMLWTAVEPRKIWNPARWVKRRKYDADELEAARMAVLDAYLERGYLDAEVDLPASSRDGRGRLGVTFPVREGPLYRFGTVGLTGAGKFPEAEVRGLVKARAGETASSSAVRGTVEAIEDFYGSRGYINAEVRPALDANPDTGVLDVSFQVVEGGLVHIRNVRIRGNTRTRDKVLRREILVYPGDVYDSRRVKRSERILTNLGYFSSVRSYALDTPDAERKDLAFDVEEKRTGQFMIGAGFSSVDRLLGFAELSQGNFDLLGWPYFMGGGQKLNLRAQFGERRKSYEFSFTEPWFLDSRLSLGCDLYHTEVNYDDYDVLRSGGAVSLGRALPWASRADLRYRLERVRLTAEADTNRYVYIDSPLEPYVYGWTEDRIESSAQLTVSHDTRDSPFMPRRGTRASVSAGLSGGPLGFDTDIYELGVQASQYFPLWLGHVLSFRARYEIVEPYGATAEVPLADRLFLGGGHTLRGFEWRDVGPKVAPEGGGAYKAVGGRSLALGSVEYTVPVIEIFRLACFYDIGNVWREAYMFDPDRLASSAGVGLRVDIPGFPIRVDRAWVLGKDHPITREDPWVVWIGYDY